MLLLCLIKCLDQKYQGFQDFQLIGDIYVKLNGQNLTVDMPTLSLIA